jgi:hypothetical protein
MTQNTTGTRSDEDRKAKASRLRTRAEEDLQHKNEVKAETGDNRQQLKKPKTSMRDASPKGSAMEVMRTKNHNNRKNTESNNACKVYSQLTLKCG